MTDQQFDEVAKQALAYDPGPVNDAIWPSVRPVRWPWLPTIRESLACGAICGLALGTVWLRTAGGPVSSSAPNLVVQSAMRDETRSVIQSVTRISGTEHLGL